MKWRVAKEISKLFVHIEEDNEGARHVASVVLNNYVAKPPEQHKAEAIDNANLMAAAPDLLKACEYTIKELKNIKGKAFPILPILEAIRKAKLTP